MVVEVGEGQMICPDCTNEITVYDGLRSWCEACGWNLGWEPPPEEESFLARQYVRLGGRYGKRVLESLKGLPAKQLRPRLTLQTIVAAVLASAVHLLSLAMLVLGVALITIGYP